MKLLNIYFTAGYPKLDSTIEILKNLDEEKVDFIELGIPYSDPLADGPTIQASSKQALDNGISIDLIFDQLGSYSCKFSQLVIMAYYNSLLSYGMKRFLKKCNEVGVKSLIIPDLPADEYVLRHQSEFELHGIDLVFLITPSTEDSRILELARMSKPFLYVVSSSSTTGTTKEIRLDDQFFKRLQSLNLDLPCLTGFNISDKASFNKATEYTDGGIIGSAFIRQIGDPENLTNNIQSFISKLRS